MAEVVSSHSRFLRVRPWARSQSVAATSRRPCGAGWGAVGCTWHKNVQNRGVLAAGADCWGEATPEKEQLTFIYGGVRHSERGRSGSSTAGRAYFECNQEGHMSRGCPTADYDAAAEAASSVAKKAT
ncbi:uncharacterized protein LOC125946329 [Dermacentor silvarum]|uniref:uncharacterized protein LOC125946329 n=1 Tax=Dermacentor silvarum TaxID=543639 RepID=UPI0021016059|nr:uncharacterized protein LOC125946329 [Dermacentor silvarum]